MNTQYKAALLMLSFLLVFPAQTKASKPQSLNDSAAKRIFAQLEKSVYQIISAHNVNAPKTSYGTAYVINGKKRWLITNYHVVSSAAEKKRMRLFLVDRKSNRRIEAFIKAMDVIADLALVESSEDLPGGDFKIRQGDVSVGERSYSLGIPEDLTMSIIEGVFNGKKGFGGFQKYVLSTPLNSGMSGGPTVDSQGQLIATNVAIYRDSNNISFAVPNEALLALLKSAESAAATPERSIASVPDTSTDQLITDEEQMIDEKWVGYFQDQFKAHQDKLAAEILEQKDRYLETSHWRARLNSENLDCWSKRAAANDGSQSISDSCFIPDASPADSSGYLGQIRFLMFESDYTKTETRLSFDKMSPGNLWMGPLLAELYRAEKCNHKIVVNQHKVPLSINYCIRSYRQYPELFSLGLNIRSLNREEKHAVNLVLTAHGFTESNVAKISRYFVDGLEVKKP